MIRQICRQQQFTISLVHPLIVCLVMSLFAPAALALPPLTDQQQARLETARDGRDHREEAFIALLENVRQWTGSIGDTPVVLRANIEQLIADPESRRGSVVRVRGRLEQRSSLERLYEGAEEWFIRDEGSTPVVVFVAGMSDAGEQWREGSQVEIFARFYKRLDAVDRQGQQRQYAAFVGAHPRLVRAEPMGGVVQLWVVAIPVLALLIAFTLLLVFVRRQRSGRRALRRALVAGPEAGSAEPLPDDPADALAELKRRAGVSDEVTK